MMSIVKMRIAIPLLALSLLLITAFSGKNTKQEGKLSDARMERRIDELIGRMTLEEKVGQMTQVTIDVISET